MAAKRTAKLAPAGVLGVAAVGAVVLDSAAWAALLGAAAAFAACWLLAPRGRRTTAVRAAKSSDYTPAAVLAFARSAPALRQACGEEPAGWLDGITLRDRRTLATAGVLHLDRSAGLTLTAAGYALASRL